MAGQGRAWTGHGQGMDRAWQDRAGQEGLQDRAGQGRTAVTRDRTGQDMAGLGNQGRLPSPPQGTGFARGHALGFLINTYRYP
jgi:hypothetical protein